MTTDPQILARLDTLGELISRSYQGLVDKRLRADPQVAWFTPAQKLPDEDRDVFFMTTSGPWAGRRFDDAWCDWGDKGILCYTEGVLMWQYAPVLE